MTAFRALQKHHERTKKVRNFKLSRAMNALKAGLAKEKAETMRTSHGSKVHLYSMVAESIKDQNEALSVFKKAQSDLRQSIQSLDGPLDFRLSIDSLKDQSMRLSQGSLL